MLVFVQVVNFKYGICFQYVPQELVPVYRDKIVPLADIVTPNQFELEWVHLAQNWFKLEPVPECAKPNQLELVTCTQCCNKPVSDLYVSHQSSCN